MKKKVLQVIIFGLFLGSLAFYPAKTVQAADMTCPTPIPVTVDIKPGSDPNPISLSNVGMVQVAVMSTQDFDATQFNPQMAVLSDAVIAMTNGCSGAMAVRWQLADVNGDRKKDLVFFFSLQDLNLSPTSTAATLMAHGTYGLTTVHILGTDSVNVVP